MNPNAENIETLEWEGDRLRYLMRLAWPIAVSMVSYSVMSLVDTAFVSRLGTSAIAGVGLAITLSFAMLCFSFGLLRAIKVLVSQSRGAGLKEESFAYLGAGLIVAVVMGGLLVGISPLVNSAMPHLSASSAASLAASEYFMVRMLGAIPLFIFVAFREFSYGCGNSRLPMMASVAANGLNIVLDYVFIVELNMGVEGAAWATVAGACLADYALCHATYFTRTPFGPWSPLQGYLGYWITQRYTVHAGDGLIHASRGDDFEA